MPCSAAAVAAGSHPLSREPVSVFSLYHRWTMSEIPPAQPKGTFLRDLLLLLGLPGALTAWLLAWAQPWRMWKDMLPQPYVVPGDLHIQDVVAGRWDWEDAERFCDENPHTISFSQNRAAMHIIYDQSWTDDEGGYHKEAIYDLQEMTPSHIRGFMRGEKRRARNGDLVVWDLVLTGPDRYAWHRTDWPKGILTDEVLRCPEIDSTDALVPSAESVFVTDSMK